MLEKVKAFYVKHKDNKIVIASAGFVLGVIVGGIAF